MVLRNTNFGQDRNSQLETDRMLISELGTPSLTVLATAGHTMRQSNLCSKTAREVSKEEPSTNAQLLMRGGFVNKLTAGVYSYLPLGMRVLQKVENIIRQEMLALGSQEILMPALQPRENWDRTGRWDTMDVLFQLKGRGDRDLALGPTHEEIVTPLIGAFLSSYADLPTSVFQIQTKFRNEARAKSGVLRGREFRMKDMYSFHTELADVDRYYELVHAAYLRVFARCGLGDITYFTYASGGDFSKYSHEYQTVTDHGEDTVFLAPDGKTAVNREVIDEYVAELQGRGQSISVGDFSERKAIEVGNIFKLGDRFSSAFGLTFDDGHGRRKPIYMGCYGIGSTRLVGTIVESFNDKGGIIWPAEVAPYQIHLVSLAREESDSRQADHVFEALSHMGYEVLYDDRQKTSPGEKLKESDLIGVPVRLVVSSRSLAQQSVEMKRRDSSETVLIPINHLLSGPKLLG